LTADTRLLTLLSSALYVSMGFTHCVVALVDERRGQIFMRSNDPLVHTLRTTPVWFARRTSALSTHRGLNLSHGLGVAIYGLMIFMLVWKGGSELPVELVLMMATGVSLIYFLVAIRYWSGIPTVGYALGGLMFLSACLTHWL
jgi:hypothetical protein